MAMLKQRRDAAEIEAAVAKLASIGLLAKLDEIALQHHATMREILSRCRTARVAGARLAVFVYLSDMRDTPNGKPNFGWSDIGRLLLRDHTTVQKAVERERAKRA